MQYLSHTLLAIMACSLVACNEKNVTPSGYEFIHHVQNNPKPPVDGDKVLFHVDIFHANELVETSRNQQKPAQLKLRKRIKGQVSSPLEEGLRLMSVNDSLTIFSRIDTLYTNYAFDESGKHLEYRIKMIDIERNTTKPENLTAGL